MAVQGTTPSAVRVDFTGVDYLTSSDIIEMHAKMKIDIDPELFGRYGTESLGIQPFIDAYGRVTPTNSVKYGHFEQDFTRELIVVDDSYTPSGATATFTVVSGYRYTYPANASESVYENYTTNVTIPVRQDDVIVGLGIEMLVTSVNYSANTFAVVCTQTGEVVPDALEDAPMYISGRAKAERASGAEGRETRLIPYENFIQIIDEAYEVSGSAMGQEGFIKSLGGSGKWYATGILNTKTNFDALCELTYLTGKKITMSNAALAGRLKTEGIAPFTESYGNVVDYDVDAFGLDEVDEMIAATKKYYGSNEYCLLESHPLSVELDDTFRTITGMDAGGRTYNQKLIDLGFSAVTRSNVKIYPKTLQGFSDSRTLGSADSEYLHYGLMIPTGTATSFDLNGGQKVQKASLNLRYQDVVGENKGMKEWVTGGAGSASTNTTDEQVISMRKRVGVDLYGANLFGAFKGAVV